MARRDRAIFCSTEDTGSETGMSRGSRATVVEGRCGCSGGDSGGVVPFSTSSLFDLSFLRSFLSLLFESLTMGFGTSTYEIH